jgi:DNA-binding NtrC family response regulator
MPKEKILIVEDEDLVRWSLEKSLKTEGYEVVAVPTGEEGLALIEEDPPHLVLLDIRLPGIDGIKVLEEIKGSDTNIQVVILSAYGTIEKAVKAMKLGAYDYISKPFRMEDVKLTIQKALEVVRLKNEVNYIRNKNKAQYGFDNIIGTSPVMREIFELIGKIAKSDATTILIEGESGTGKDLIARAIHYQSKRSEYPFMEINVTSLPETLFESELFGHEKGAFTDAKSIKKGLFELADGGTILLDEIGEMGFRIQAKLLHVLEGRSFKRVGGVKDIKVDVRIIAATNKDLGMEVKNGNFREDLYYRLKVVPICLPPLRERKEDILILASYFIQHYNKEFKKNFCSIDPEAQKLLLNYPWPGNVRELKNVIERVLILESGTTIKPEHLPPEIIFKEADENKKGIEIDPSMENLTLESVEINLIKKALNKTGGNQTKAAQLLGISRDVLRYRIKKYQLTLGQIKNCQNKGHWREKAKYFS